MSPLLNCAQTALTSVSALALLLSQPVLAVEVNVHTPEIHVPTPQIHVPTPQVHISSPTVRIKTLDVGSRQHLQVEHRGDLNPGRDKGQKGSTPSSPGLAGVGSSGNIVQPPGVGRNATVGTVNSGPPGIYNPNCPGGSDCGPVTGPVSVVTLQNSYSGLSNEALAEQVANLEALIQSEIAQINAEIKADEAEVSTLENETDAASNCVPPYNPPNCGPNAPITNQLWAQVQQLGATIYSLMDDVAQAQQILTSFTPTTTPQQQEAVLNMEASLLSYDL